MHVRTRPSLIEIGIRVSTLTVANMLLAALVVFTYAGVTEATNERRLDQTVAIMLTSLILIGWVGWVVLNSLWFIRNRGASLLATGIAALVILSPSLLLLVGLMSFSNSCNAAQGFPFDSSC